MMERAPQPVREMLALLRESGHTPYLVGGCVRDLLRGGQTFLGGLVACVRGLRAAVDTGDINAPALLILHRTGAAAVGAVLQFDLINRVHGIILSYRAKLTVCAEII